jgi:DNA-binding MarR family transcriptional regulator
MPEAMAHTMIMGDVSDVAWQPTVPALLQRVAASGGARLGAAFAAAGLDGIRPAQALALVPLMGGALHASALADRLGVTRQAVAQAVRALERHGYVQRSPDDLDGRVLLIELTPRGREALRVMRANAVATERDWRDKLGNDRFNELRDALRILIVDDTASLAKVRR